ncbi:MAG: DUF4954 family protein, partial [Treponema sp.]|nr:DUF4954 family protein [Treponema sp.]
MPEVKLLKDRGDSVCLVEHVAGKRQLSQEEIAILIQNRNISSDPEWKNVFVCEGEGEFDPSLISQSEFNGVIVLGMVRPATLRFHDLELNTGIYRSVLYNVVIGDDCVVHNVGYLSNYKIGDRVMLFNVQEMSCTKHSKFGEGILKEGEGEENRIWIGVGNENGNRGILAFTDMIAADAYLWSRFREDQPLMD